MRHFYPTWWISGHDFDQNRFILTNLNFHFTVFRAFCRASGHGNPIKITEFNKCLQRGNEDQKTRGTALKKLVRLLIAIGNFVLLAGTRAGRVLDSFCRANSCLELSSSWFQTQSNISTFQFIMYFFALFIGRFIIINIGLGWKNWNYAQTSCNVFLAVEGVTFSVKTPLVVTNQKTIVTNLFTRVL